VEQVWDRNVESFFRHLGWKERVITYTGYGSERFVRVLGRVVLRRPKAVSGWEKAFDDFVKRRGFRNYLTTPCVHADFKIRLGGKVYRSQTDRGGYIDMRLFDHGLTPGWHEIVIQSGASPDTIAYVQIIPDSQEFGIVSDIDDTIISTYLPRPLIAAWNGFIRDEHARQAIPGMAVMYREFTDFFGQAPVFYLSTGAWNTQPFLTRFLRRHRFPVGPMLLTDWGPTNTGFFRSGIDHKINSVLQLFQDFPNIRWLLVGDNGQHDPQIYSDFAVIAPDKIRAVGIRQLTATEQILSHGTTVPQVDGGTDMSPWVEAPDGRGLLRQLRPILEGKVNG
jgi:phosphatidate phosphatase APP1